MEVGQKMPDYSIIFKLHPKQYGSWREQFREMLCAVPPNVSILGEKGPSLYELFATSAIQVGVFSTALYEGLGFGLRTIICQLPGYIFVEKLIEAKYADLAKNGQDIIRLISSGSNKRIDIDHFFRSSAIRNKHDAVDRILEDVR